MTSFAGFPGRIRSGVRSGSEAAAQAQQALTLRTQVTARGFVNANIIQGCDGFRVVVRGIDTFDVGVDLQNEARREAMKNLLYRKDS